METKANYVLIGAFTLLVGVFGLLFALWAANWSSQREWRNYRIIFNEPVTGLTEGSGVRYNGINVGSIETLSLVPDDPRQVVAVVRLQEDTPIKTDTTAKLSQDGRRRRDLAQRDRDVRRAIRREPSRIVRQPGIVEDTRVIRQDQL